MNCNEARLHWDLYYDSEGDPEIHLQLNRHLGSCSHCANWFNNQSRLESLIEERVNADSSGSNAVEADWDSLLSNLRAASSKKTARNWLWIGAPMLAIGALVLLIVWVTGERWSDDRSASLSFLSSELHQHVSTGSLRPELESESDQEVDTFFLKRVSFPVRCPPRKDSGFAVRGAGLCELANQPAAYVVGNVDNQPVSIFVLPVECLEMFPHQRDELMHEPMRICREGRNDMVYAIVDKNVVLVIGSASLEKLTRVLKSYGSYPHAS